MVKGDSTMLKNNSVAIYIAETDHGDMPYSSLLQKMIEIVRSQVPEQLQLL